MLFSRVFASEIILEIIIKKWRVFRHVRTVGQKNIGTPM